MGYTHWNCYSGCCLLCLRRFQLDGRECRSLISGSWLGLRFHRRSIPGYAWVLGAAVGDGDGRDTMPWYVGPLGWPICRWADDSSRSSVANYLERSGRCKSSYRCPAIHCNSCRQTTRDTGIRCAQLITATSRDRLQQPAILLMWTRGRSTNRERSQLTVAFDVILKFH